jgi:hypothetical protein
MAINRNLSILAQGASASGNLLNYAGANKIINGDMVIDQRNAGASVTPTVNPTYTLDRWTTVFSAASKFSVQQNAGSVAVLAGMPKNYAGITSLSSYSLSSSDYFFLTQYIEGLNCADLNFGSSIASDITLSFWVRSSLTGTFGGVLQNSAQNRTYCFSYSIASANTWTKISVTIPGDQSGTWLTTNGIGLRVFFTLGTGSTFKGTPAGWGATAIFAPTGAVDIVATNSATWYVTGVKLEVGTVATPFVPDDYAVSLQKCRRYYYQVNGTSGASNRFGLGIVVATTIGQGIIISGLGSMRTDPSISGNNVDLYDATAAPTVTAFYLTANNGGVAPTFQFNTSVASLTVGRAVMALFNSTSGKLLIDAEL